MCSTGLRNPRHLAAGLAPRGASSVAKCLYWSRRVQRRQSLGERGCVSAPSSPGANATGLAWARNLRSRNYAPCRPVAGLRWRTSNVKMINKLRGLSGLKPASFTMADFFRWSLPLGRFFGIPVRVHILFPIFAIGIILRVAYQPGVAPGTWIDAAVLIGLLFAVVLLHEFGHCFGARAVDGDAQE